MNDVQHTPAPATTSTNRRHHKRSAAIVDRLTFNGQIIETGTASYRLAHARATKTKKPDKAPQDRGRP